MYVLPKRCTMATNINNSFNNSVVMLMIYTIAILLSLVGYFVIRHLAGAWVTG